MRLEDIGNGNYIKAPDKLEHELVRTVNRFFNSDMDDFEKSKEAIIIETQRRLKPLIVNLVKRIAWEQGKEIYEPMIREIIDGVLDDEIKNLRELIQAMKNEFLKHKTFHSEVMNDTTTIVDFPVGLEANIINDVIIVEVNGQKQIEGINYSVIVAGNLAKSIEFFDSLDTGDNVFVECWIYNIMTGGTP